MKTLLSLLLFLLAQNVFASAADFELKSETTFNPSHENRFSFLLGVNPSITKAADIKSFGFSYSKKSNEFWWDSNLFLTNGVFSKVTTNNPAATGLTNDQLSEATPSTITGGIGLGLETRYFQTLLPFENIYEFTAVNITYNRLKEETSGQTFSGPGMLAKFQLYKRYSDYMSFGGQFIYLLAPLKRGANNDTENSSARTLTMSTLTVGFDLSFYL